MMKKNLLIAMLFFQYCGYSQVVIGSSAASSKNILKIQDGTKGVLLSYANIYTSFPKYNASAPDVFDDYPNLIGGLIYNKNDDQYYKYDGYSWNPSRQIQGIYQPKASRLGVSSGITIPCISFGIGFCFAGSTPTYLAADNRSQVLVDNLALKNTSNVTIKQSGIYDVGVALGFTGGSLGFQVGITEFKLTLQVKYTSSSDWETVVSKTNYSIVFVVDTQGNKTSSFSQTISLPAGAELRVVPEISSNAISGGALAAYGTDTNSINSYIAARLIKNY
ncbi:hypothetical protein ACM39_10865 [Chryseobacterium sp. FH2]|uniref:hypothetical protein n=1 Tax=Chryseobacterium sp. FH2 TaxID=1674291 RepID=UPI00065B01E0|nr:hypothetical protein [Chryseobacterium sp. FH2]KMQ67837.1 hypothetical protein ACM39_10865 [Chryseobacterium sp. FH2]